MVVGTGLELLISVFNKKKSSSYKFYLYFIIFQVQAPYKSNQYTPCVRYQHSVHFVGPLFFVIGGRTTQNEENSLPIDCYDTISSEWCRFSSINRYRHASFVLENLLYIQGGFEPEAPNKPLDAFSIFDTSKIALTFPKLWKYFSKDGQNGSQLVSQQSSQQSLNMSVSNNSNNSQVLQETFKANKSNTPQPLQQSVSSSKGRLSKFFFLFFLYSFIK